MPLLHPRLRQVRPPDGAAGELGLLVTGSSDFHGTNKQVRLGAHTTSEEQYERLVAAADGRTPVLAA